MYNNGDRYTGEYKDGKPYGYGEYFWLQGANYKGHFRNGLMDGKGTYINARGDKYEGNYKEGKKSGYGEFTWVSGNSYKGNYENDLREGSGEMRWTDGSYYIGPWVKGIQHGIGEMIIPGRKKLNGMFENNVFIGEQQISKKASLPLLSKPNKTSANAQKFQMKKADINNLHRKGYSEGANLVKESLKLPKNSIKITHRSPSMKTEPRKKIK